MDSQVQVQKHVFVPVLGGINRGVLALFMPRRTFFVVSADIVALGLAYVPTDSQRY